MHSAAVIPKALQLQAAKKSEHEGPSLLAADSEEEPSSDEGSDMEDKRPSLLPLNEAIRAAPTSLSSLLEVMVPRLQQRSGIKGVSLEDQQSFVSILVGELSSHFSDLKNQIDDPFLNPQENRTLHRLVVVQVCRILEDLYSQYTAKAARLCDDGSLSLAAHMSRLRAQLAVQVNRSINLPAIRRQVLSQLRGPLPTSRPSRLPPVPRWRPPPRPQEKTDLDSLNLGAHLSSRAQFSLASGGSAVLRRKRVQKLVAGMAPHGLHNWPIAAGTAGARDPEPAVSDAAEQSLSRPSSPEPTSKLERAPSMPELYGNFLLCDWKLLARTPYHVGLPSSDQRRDNRQQALHTARRASIGSNTGHDGIKWTSEPPKVKTKLGDFTREDLNSDLHHLSEVEPSFVHTVAQDDIDPLLQASEHGLSERQRSRLAAHDLEVRRRREEEQRKREEEERARREAEALPTLEDMEKMQFLRSQAPPSLSHSHASLHMRSNASDWQSASQALSSHQPFSNTNLSLWSEAGGGLSQSNSLLSSAGGLSELDLPHSHSGLVERQSLPHSHFASDVESQHGRLHFASSHCTGSVSQRGSLTSHLDNMKTTPQLGKVRDVETASWQGSACTPETGSHSGSASTTGTNSRHGATSNIETAPQSRAVSNMDTFSHISLASGTTLSRDGSASTIDTASRLESPTASKMEPASQYTSDTGDMDTSSDGESVSNIIDTLSHAVSVSNASQRGSASTIHSGLWTSKIEPSPQHTAAVNTGDSSAGTPSRHGSASTIDTASIYRSATDKMEPSLQHSSASSHVSTPSCGGSASSTDRSSRQGSASTIDIASQRGSATNIENYSRNTSASDLSTSSDGESASSTVTPSQHGSARTTESASRRGSTTASKMEIASETRSASGYSASNALTPSRPESASSIDTASRYTRSSSKMETNASSHGGSTSHTATSSQHGSASTLECASRIGSASKMETSSQYTATASHMSTSSRDRSAGSRPSQHGSASTTFTGSRHGSASTIGTGSRHGSASTIGTGSRHRPASTIGTGSRHGSASTIGTGSRHGSASTIGTGSRHRPASTIGTGSRHGSASTIGTGSRHGSASTIGTGSRHGSASTIGTGSRHGPDTASKHRSVTDSQMETASDFRPISNTTGSFSQGGSASNTAPPSRSSNTAPPSRSSSASNTPSRHRHGSASISNTERASRCSSGDTASQHEIATTDLDPPDTAACLGSAASSSSSLSLISASHHSSVSSIIPDSASQQEGSSRALGSLQALKPQAAAQYTGSGSGLLTANLHQQHLLQNSTLSLSSGLSGNTMESKLTAASSRDILVDTLPAVESRLTAVSSVDGERQRMGSGVSLPGSQQGMEGEVESVGGEDPSCEGSGGGWDDFGGGQSFSDMKSFTGTSFSDLGSQGEQRETAEHEPENKGPQPQPAVITSIINDQVVRSSDMCVSERAPLTTLRLKPYQPIWNELAGELDWKTVEEMDSNLTEGQEMEILYHELMKTIPKDYLDMESEPSLIPVLPESVDLASELASSSLPHRPSRRVANPELRPVSTLAPPWGDKAKKDQWKKSNLYTGPDPKELMAPKGSTLTPAQARQRQQYQNWLKWWRSTISCDDYLKFVAQKETDYLHHLYHLYDSEGSESEGEEERERRVRLVRLHSKLQAKHARREERYRKKTQYEQGMWNIDTVMMGGLGGDPHSSGTSSEEDLEDQLRQLEQKTEEPEQSVQERFQAVWSRLQLSQQQSMDMAAKYSSHKYQQHIRKAISLWERACDMIERREERLEELQTFEQSASDPSRLFVKGQDGPSNFRLKEAKKRKQINSVLGELEQKLFRLLRKLQSRFGDVVTYKGRPYHEKMQHDRTELLYLLQQERRRAQLPSPPPEPHPHTTTATLWQASEETPRSPP